MKKYSTALMIFRRDLRLDDNTALNAALANAEQVIPCFIFDPRQVTSKNRYRSIPALQFMIESLDDLSRTLAEHGGRLYTLYGISEEVVDSILEGHAIEAVFVNRDYTPFSRMRDEALRATAEKNGAAFYSMADALLHEPEEIATQSGTPYTVFTAFYKRSLEIPVREPEIVRRKNFFTGTLKHCTEINLSHELTARGTILTTKNELLAVHGGRSEAIKIVKHLDTLSDYEKTRDFPSILTSRLSAHNKFGTVSIRELYHATATAVGREHPLLRQYYWRDFYIHIAHHFPHVFGRPFHKKYESLAWSNNKEQFMRWCEGKTGFPIVDAGMRELVTTGYMHNRVRMIVASFLTKDLHIDWRWGEQFFALNLVDYDPAVNNGNWQWSSSTGCDAAPYFRIFNPWLQQEKFDPECAYIKKWVPELANIPAAMIHKLHTGITIAGYPRPIVDHSEEIVLTKKLYSAAAQEGS